MPIANIVDRRPNTYKFACVNVVAEAAWHDNPCEGADQILDRAGPAYEQKEHVSLADAIAWANSFPDLVTLYIYDEHSGIYVVRSTQGGG